MPARVNPTDLLLRAEAASANDNRLGATRALTALASALPGDGDIRRRAIDVAIDAGDIDGALALARTVPAGSLDLKSRFLLVADAFRRGRAEEGIRLFPASLGDKGGGFLKPFVALWAGPADGSAIVLASDSVLQAMMPEQRFYRLARAGRGAEAMAQVGEALRFAGDRSIEARMSMAQTLLVAGDRANAARLVAGGDADYVAALEAPGAPFAVRTPGDALALLYLGFASSIDAGDDRTMVIALARLARLAAPARAEPVLMLARALAAADRADEAIALLAGANLPPPLFERAADLRAELLSGAGRAGEAIAFSAPLDAARRARAADAARLGAALDTAGRRDEARVAFARAIQRADAEGSAQRWTYRLMLADLDSKAGDWTRARRRLEEALLIAPDNPILLNYLGYGDLERGLNLAAAEAMIRRAHALAPRDASITDSLGWALFKRGQRAEAIDRLRVAAEGDPGQAEIHEHLGDALWTDGQRFAARYSWEAGRMVAEGAVLKRLEDKLKAGLTAANAAP